MHSHVDSVILRLVVKQIGVCALHWSFYLQSSDDAGVLALDSLVQLFSLMCNRIMLNT